MALDPLELRLKQFEIYRSEDKHECTLLSQRITAFLTSQSFLVVATGAVYANLYLKQDPTHTGPVPAVADPIPIVTFIALFAIALAIIAFTAIVIGCLVLRRWHQFGARLVAMDKRRGEDFLKGFHFNRKQADWAHFFSMDVFNTAIPFVFLTGWICVIAKLHSSWVILLSRSWFAMLILWLGTLALIVWYPDLFRVGKIDDSDLEKVVQPSLTQGS
jgi:hypothetical protein